MKSLFSKGSKNGASNPPATAPPVKKDLQVPQISPLEKRLQDMGSIREDGSDKFYGMENYGNTCYCNSILQCLYYSVPFREAVINYPQRTPMESLEAALAKNLRYQDPNAYLEAEALAAKQKASSPPSARQAGVPPNPNQKPEDKESPEYKKKVALQTLPILETKNNATSYGMSESLFTSLKDIFESVVGSQARIGIVRPQQFLDVLRREHEMFRTAMHQDAHEFLNLLLNEVVANVETEATKQAFADKALPPTESADSLGMLTSSTGSKSPNTTRWVHELFEGTLTSETKCLTCEKVSQRDEVFLDLSVDLEQHSSVTSCLRKFSAEEMLCERNKFHCDNCGGLQEAEKRMKIKRLPRVLALHLKRFKYTEDLQRLQKLFHRVVYPYHLRLFNTTDDAEDPDRLYELYAVVVHIGGGPYHGHYVAIIKTEDRGWLLFDDELVEPVDKNYVRNFFGDRPGLACAYVLFYQETTLEAVMREQAQEDQASSTATAETGEAAKPNGSPFSPPLAHAQSAPFPSESTAPFTPLSRIPTAPPLSTYPEEPSEPQLPSPRSAQPPLPPIPDESAPPLSPKKSDHQLRKERRAMEKEKEKNEKNRQREQDLHNREIHRREVEELRKAIEASKADTGDFAAENGSPRKSSSFGFLKRGSRSLSQRLSKEREPRVSTSDLSATPLLPKAVPEALLKEAEPSQPFHNPVQPIKPIHSAQSIHSPVSSSSPRDFPPISNPKQPKQPIQPIRAPEPLAKDQHTNHTKPGHTPRWRSFSFKKVS
ncbi:Peptidase C19 ubiquitin carboxyl-terminal hydrolase 2 [Penicillium cf. griseofulvum]|uniref:Ubiquitin carboxyl-terminal hydrolase n=1 Tax=Penicillium cf. griseofulvum TaxID=2972120 RepID=A0A9W9T1Q7_9EURO|nr:Peptidase C19 ubiquitin carboxyl-terminal hydrolase 2 [Penicillium cf. griseofulvum]KAJ5448782.1 Peptidase C19 ubiquitin carboxyl-terminal hydrolase 2 [Penicillium cf. griseofulvum]